jgi:hypothetical protein
MDKKSLYITPQYTEKNPINKNKNRMGKASSSNCGFAGFGFKVNKYNANAIRSIP